VSLVLTGLSGEGTQSLSGGTFVTCTDVLVQVSAYSPKSYKFGSITPVGFKSLGEVFLGYKASGTVPPQYAWGFFINHQYMDIQVPIVRPSADQFSDVWWRVNVGVVLDLTVFF
jgi:hypothetical protein